MCTCKRVFILPHRSFSLQDADYCLHIYLLASHPVTLERQALPEENTLIDSEVYNIVFLMLTTPLNSVYSLM